MKDQPLSRDAQPGTPLPAITRVIRQPLLRSRTFGGYNRVHWDPEFARKQGFPGPIVTGQLLTAYLQEMLVAFFGVHAFRSMTFNCRYAKPAFLDDTITTGGSIAERETTPDGVRLSAEVWCSNQRGERVTTGMARCLIPVDA